MGWVADCRLSIEMLWTVPQGFTHAPRTPKASQSIFLDVRSKALSVQLWFQFPEI